MVIIGSGLAGLTAAVALKETGVSVTVLEKSDRAGGAVRTEQDHGFFLEFGPNTIQSTPNLINLVHTLGLESQLLIKSPRTPRYVLHNGALHAVPLSPLMLFTSSLLTLRGKLRLLREPFVPFDESNHEETLLAFAKRRLGEEVTDRLIAPFVSGVWAGDVSKLSAWSAFPKLHEWEKNFGSLLKGMLRSGKPKASRATPRGLVSFRQGIETLTKEMAARIGNELRTNFSVSDLRPTKTGWEVSGSSHTLSATHVILAAPAKESARIVHPLSPAAAEALREIRYAPVAVLHFGFRKNQIGSPKEGFGYLVAPTENSDILGCLWSSNLFPERAPDDHVLWTVFMGGDANASLLRLSDDELKRRALENLRPTMKLTGEPVFARLTRHAEAIPQYTIGHAERLRKLKEAEQNYPGLSFVGNYRGGISVGDVVNAALALAAKISA